MEKEQLQYITQTVEGNPVKGLILKKVDNIISGLVYDPIAGSPSRDMYRSATWRISNGSLTPNYGGSTRKDLYLDFSKLNLELKK